MAHPLERYHVIPVRLRIAAAYFQRFTVWSLSPRLEINDVNDILDSTS